MTMEEALCPPGVPCRIGYWNIAVPLRVVFFVTIGISLIIMAWGIYKRVQLWRQGQHRPMAFDQPLRRTGRVLEYAIAQVKILRQSYPAAMHLAIFWAFVLLFIGTTLAGIDQDIYVLLLRGKLLLGSGYTFYKTVLDLAGLFFLVGLGLAVYRRYILRSPRLNIDWRFNFTLPLLTFIVLTGLLIEAVRLAVVQPAWAPYSVVGYPISLLFRGGNEAALRLTHQGLWTIHWIAVALFFATLPWTNLYHIFSSAWNTFATPFKGRGVLKPIPDLENAERLGAGALPDFDRYELTNFDACTECGRCQVVCPAYAAQQPLNPKYVVLNLRDYMGEKSPRPLGLVQAAAGTPTYAVLHRQSAGVSETGGNGHGTKGSNGSGRPMVGSIVTPDALWACTTCLHCVYECPVLIEHVDAIVDMRRYLALAEGTIPSALARTLTNMERAGNPWKLPQRKRAAWAESLDFEVPSMADVREAGVLWFVGCAGSYDPRSQHVTRAIARILHAAGVQFAILGEEETCNGDQARRAGNEYLFQQLATQSIGTLNQYKFGTLLTQCPHCYNFFKNEAVQLGGNYHVIHHTQFIASLLAQAKIDLAGDLTHDG
ncbi:MAG: heterodisulfide reductase-related iron-sulfur binding cluster, partial [Bacteroidota bacterium]